MTYKEYFEEGTRRDFLKKALGAAASAASAAGPAPMRDLAKGVSNVVKSAAPALYKVVKVYYGPGVSKICDMWDASAASTNGVIKSLIDTALEDDYQNWLEDDISDEYYPASWIGGALVDNKRGIGSVTISGDTIVYIVRADNPAFKTLDAIEDLDVDNLWRLPSDVVNKALDPLTDWEEEIGYDNYDDTYADQKREELKKRADKIDRDKGEDDQDEGEDDQDEGEDDQDDPITYSRMDYAGGSEDEGYGLSKEGVTYKQYFLEYFKSDPIINPDLTGNGKKLDRINSRKNPNTQPKEYSNMHPDVDAVAKGRKDNKVLMGARLQNLLKQYNINFKPGTKSLGRTHAVLVMKQTPHGPIGTIRRK